MHPADPNTGEVGESDEVVVRGQRFCLGPAHPASRHAATFGGFTGDYPAHGRIAPKLIRINLVVAMAPLLSNTNICFAEM
jgi:hypothetical protein